MYNCVPTCLLPQKARTNLPSGVNSTIAAVFNPCRGMSSWTTNRLPEVKPCRAAWGGAKVMPCAKRRCSVPYKRTILPCAFNSQTTPRGGGCEPRSKYIGSAAAPLRTNSSKRPQTGLIQFAVRATYSVEKRLELPESTHLEVGEVEHVERPDQETLERLAVFARALVRQEDARVLVPPHEDREGFWFGAGNLVPGPDGALYLVGRYRDAGDSRSGLGAGTRGSELAVFRSDDRARSFRKILSFFDNLPHLDLVGDFHSHPNALPTVSKEDVETMRPGDLAIIVEIRDRAKDQFWRYNEDGTLSGSTDEHFLKVAAFTKDRRGKVSPVEILCPFAIGFDIKGKTSSEPSKPNLKPKRKH